MDSDARLGTGLGWRPGLAGLIASRLQTGDLGFVEVLAEHVDPRRLPGPLTSLRDKNVPIVIHGLGLSLGGAERPGRRRLRHLAACAQALRTPLVSEHLAFVRAGGHDSGHLLPVPRTREALDVVCANIAEAQANLPVPLALENIATRHNVPSAVFELLAELGARRAPPGVLIERDGNFPPEAELDAEIRAVHGVPV